MGEERKFHLVSWNKVRLLLSCGGLGVRNLRLLNKALGFGGIIMRVMHFGEILWMLNIGGCGGVGVVYG